MKKRNLEKRIKNLAQLAEARNQKRAIACPTFYAFRGPLPAAWMMNLSGEILHRLFENGMWLYRPNNALSKSHEIQSS